MAGAAEQLQGILDPLDVSQPMKAQAWDLFQAARDPEDFRRRFDPLPIPKEAKAALWEAKFGGAARERSEALVRLKTPAPENLPTQAEFDAAHRAHVAGVLDGLTGPLPGTELTGLPGVPLTRPTPVDVQRMERSGRSFQPLAQRLGGSVPGQPNLSDYSQLLAAVGLNGLAVGGATASSPLTRRALAGLQSLLGAYFGYEMGRGTLESGKKGFEAAQEGDYPEALRQLGNAGLEGFFAYHGGKSALQRSLVFEPWEAYAERQASVQPSARDAGVRGAPVEPEVMPGGRGARVKRPRPAPAAPIETPEEVTPSSASPQDTSRPSALPALPTSGRAAAASSRKLPRDLAGAKPRYAMGGDQYDVTFEDDLDRAAYITTQPKPSKRDADFVQFVMDETGLDENDVRALGGLVRTQLKGEARRKKGGGLLEVGPILRPYLERQQAGAAAPAEPEPQQVQPEAAAPKDAQAAITDFNKKASAELAPAEQAVADGRRLSARTIDRVVAKLEDSEGTLADALRGDKGGEIVNSLVEDGVITTQEKNAYVDERQQLTTEGKARIAKALVGRMFNTPAQLTGTPPEMRNKLERIAPHVLRVEGRAGWSITQATREALDLLEDMRAHGGRNVLDVARQGVIGGGGKRYSPQAIEIARTLQQGPVKAAAAFRRYANDEALSREGAQEAFFEPPTQQEAFADAFGDGAAEPIKGKAFEPAEELRVPKLRDHLEAGSTEEFFHRIDAKYEALLRGEPGHVYVNPPAHALIVAVGLEPFEGLTLGAEESRRLYHNLGAMAAVERDPELAAGIERLRAAMRDARRETRVLTFVLAAGPGARRRTMRQARREEAFHRQQILRNQGHVLARHVNPLRMLAVPEIRKAYAATRKLREVEGQTAFLEMGAILATGQWPDLGLTQAEAETALYHYLAELERMHGKQASGIIDYVEPVLRRSLASRRQASRAMDQRAVRRRAAGEGIRPGPGGPGSQGKFRSPARGREEGPRGVPREVQRNLSAGDLFASEEVAASQEAAAHDEARLLGERLTAQFKSGMAKRPPKRGAPEETQTSLFEETPEKAQPSLFDELLRDTRGGGPPIDVEAAKERVREGARVVRDFFLPGGELLAQQGQAGRQIKKLIDTAFDRGELAAGKRVVRLLDAGVHKLDRAERWDLLDALEGRTEDATERTWAVHDVVRAVLDEMATRAVDLGVKVRYTRTVWPGEDPAGLNQLQRARLAAGHPVRVQGKRAFRPRRDYFPHVIPNPAQLEKPIAGKNQLRADVVENLVRQGVRPDRASAERMVDGYAEWVKDGGRNGELERFLVESGQAADSAEALWKLQRYRQRTLKRAGSLEFAREIDLPFYDPDPARVLPGWVSKQSLRLAQVEVLGQDNQRINRLVKRVEDTGGDAELARRAVDQILEMVNEPATPGARLARALRTLNGFKLGLSAVANVTQGALNSLLASDLTSTIAGVRGAATKEGRRMAAEAGAALEAVIQESMRHAGQDGVALATFLRATGFSGTERLNRIVAANAGAKYAERLRNRLQSKPGDGRARAMLEELGLDPDHVQGPMGPDEVLVAAKRFSDLTQFRSRPQDIPLWASTPAGQMFFQFKSYLYGQTRLVYRELVGEMRAGRFGRGLRALLILATVFPLTGKAVKAVREFITGRMFRKEKKRKAPADPKLEALKEYLDSAAQVGAAGVLGDLMQSGRWSRGVEFFAGPTLGTLGETVDAAAKGDKRALLRQALTPLPVGRELILDELAPRKPRSKKRGN